MMAGGNYVMTYMNGEPRYDKPILIYWLQAASVGLFGLNEFALRLPSAMAASFWVLVTFLFVRKKWDADKAFLAAFFLVTAAQVTIIAKAAIADALLNCLIAITMFSVYRYCESNEKKYMYVSFAAMALGMLTKGPVAVLIPFAVSFLFCLLQKDLKRWFKAVTNPIGIVIFLAITLPWYVLVIRDQGMGFIHGFFMEQNVKRFSGSFEGHAGSLLYYIPVVIVGVLPYTTLLFKSVRNFRADFGAPITQYMVLWFAFVFVFFSFSGTKLPHYVIYGYTPLFILMALHIDDVRSDKLLILPAFLFFVAAMFAPLVITLVIPHIKDEFTAAMLQGVVNARGWTYTLALGGAAYVAGVLLSAPQIQRRTKLVVIGLLTMLAVNLLGMSLAAKVMHEPVREAALIAREHDYSVVMWKMNMPSFVFYQGKLTEKRLPRNGDIIFTQMHQLQALADAAKIIYQKNGYVLAQIVHIYGT